MLSIYITSIVLPHPDFFLITFMSYFICILAQCLVSIGSKDLFKKLLRNSSPKNDHLMNICSPQGHPRLG